ncbi:MAG: CDP-diacylglycerol--glycerol-3-phosphate 3-phosphatidyltransferase [Alphaproteobacteria bacterium]|nr:CDP-diacylglycerol--glycerol-3-phosphate 3-phosphatidyltransferase [Alphaproteobacteria bacterium]
MRKSIPNALTIYRLLAAPAFVAIYELFPRPFSDWAALVLFVTAAFSDYLDGYLARRWKQVSKFGRMMDPIADKAMTILALVMLMILLLQGNRTIVFPAETNFLIGDWILVTPIMIIIFREIFVSGLREFVSTGATDLAVTGLAKWKTAIQMLAIITLIVFFLFENYLVVLSFAMERSFVADVLKGIEPDEFGLRWKYAGWVYTYNIGFGLLWLAATMTLWTGIDYFLKALPLIRDSKS